MKKMNRLFNLGFYFLVFVALIVNSNNAFSQGKVMPLFNMPDIRDVSTLKVEIIEDWHLVDGEIQTRQKYISINVGELWPGQDYRIPIRMVVPGNSQATGFHLTGGNNPKELVKDKKLKPFEMELIAGGVGLVYTIVQTPHMFGQKELGDEMNKRFIQTLNPHYSIQYWAWPATIMRAVTAAYAEANYFEKGKIAVSGGSKNGASPSVALIADDRITAQHANVSPIWDSPLRLCEKQAWEQLEKENTRYAKELESQPEKLKSAKIGKHVFLGGTFGPIYNKAALDAGHSWDDIQKLANDLADDIFISRNIEKLKERNVDLLFHPGTHDFVNYDIQWGGKHHPEIPIYLKANTGHGKNRGHHAGEKNQQNLTAFLIEHFFGDMNPMLQAPKTKYEIEGNTLRISVWFKQGSEEESGRIWWMFDRYSDGTAAYIMEHFPDENWKDMTFDKENGMWQTEIDLPLNAAHIDFFSTHGKTIHRNSTEYNTYISSPYTRIDLE